MHTCDVAIVGGGPAGSACAGILARSGLDVVVCDRQQFPRDKICAGWITPQLMAALDLHPESYAATGRTFQTIRGFRISRMGDADVRVEYDHPVSYGIRRCEFDTHLLQRSGATLRLGEPIRSLEKHNDHWVLNRTLRATMLVGAGGHFCPVAQHLGARLGGGEPIVAAQEVEFELPWEEQRSCTVEPEVPELYFTRDLKGYGWVVRKGSYINIGLGRQDSEKLARHVEEFVVFLGKRRKIPAAVPAQLRGHPYLLYGDGTRRLVGDGVLVIGDAGGLAYDKSGEGIRPAVESGLLAAQTIIDARGAYDQATLAAYDRRIIARFGPRRTASGITDFLPHWIAGPLAARMLATPRFARSVVLDRWFFHVDQEPLRLPIQTANRPSDVSARVADARR